MAKILDFNTIKKHNEEEDAKQTIEMYIVTLKDEIDDIVDKLAEKYTNREDYLVTLFNIKEQLQKFL